jgi:HemY protein
MRSAFWFAFLFALAVVIALFATGNAGHATIYFPPYRIDISLNLFIAVVLGAFIISLLTWKTISAILNLPKQAAAYRRKRREARAAVHLTEAIEDIFAGRFSKALKAAEAASANTGFSETAYLLAARAAHLLNQFNLRDEWLAKIKSSDKQQARLVATADMQMSSDDAQGALNTIEQLQKGGSRQILVQRIALRANQRLRRWDEVLRLTHSLMKRDALHPVVAQKSIQEALSNLTRQKFGDHEALLKIWKNLPKSDRKASGVTLVMAKSFLGAGKHNLARDLIEESIELDWDEGLIKIYPECVVAGQAALSEIQKLESWMTKYPSEPALYLALGRVCLIQQLWGKAKSSLQSVIRDPKAKPAMKAAAHMSIAQLHEKLSEPQEAAEQYQFAAKLYASLG